MGFDVDPRWLESSGNELALKVTYFDKGRGLLKLQFDTPEGPREKAVMLSGSGELRTVTFFLEKMERVSQE